MIREADVNEYLCSVIRHTNRAESAAVSRQERKVS